MEEEPRTILVHLNIEVPTSDPHTADELADDLERYLRNWATFRHADLCIPLAEEV